MTREAHLPGACPPSSETVARVRATVYGPQLAELARLANYACLDCPAGRFGGADLSPGTVAFTFVPGDTPAGRYLRVTVRLVPAASVTTTGTVTLTVTDDLGNSLTGAASTIPLGFRGESLPASSAAVGSRFDFATVLTGDFDLAAMAATLTGPTWVWSFVTTLGGGADSLVTVDAEELPRFLVDTAETYGALPGAYLGGAEIDDGSATGTERILTTLVGARTTQRVYLSRAWPQDTATAPSLSATSWVAFSSFDEGTGPETTRVYVRRLATASAQGEPIRYRVLYRLSGGAGTETADVRLSTGSSSSPFGLSLAHTGTSWVWSSWKTGYLKTDEATAGLEQTDTIGLEGRLSAGGPTLYLAGIDVRSAAT